MDGREPPAEVLWPKHLALLLYLALSPDRRRTRDHLLGIFWAEKPDAQARHALNEALRRLRAALGRSRLVSVADSVAISDTGLAVDALRFATLADNDPGEAATLLQGDFLEGFAVSDTPAFDQWALGERERYRSRAASLLVTLGERQLAGCRFVAASDLGQRALAIQPYSEPASRLVMRAAALAGDTASALAAYHKFVARLEADVGEQPGRDLTALADRIRRRPERPPAPEEPPPPPLIGRDEVHQTLFGLLDQGLRNGPWTVVITGSPGMGRTRLLDECIQRLTLEGALIARARPLHSDHDAPWSTLRTLMRTGLQRAQGLVGASTDALSVLASLVPELSGRASRAPRDAADAAHAITSVLAAVVEDQPVVLAIDDAHLADGATIGALAAALEHVRAAPIVGLFTAVDGAPAPSELLALRGQLGRAVRGSAIRLDALSADDVKELVSGLAPWCRGDDERDRLARRLMFESGGNPFFAVTLLNRLDQAASLRDDLLTWPRAQETLGHPLPFSIPGLLNLSVAGRVAALQEEHRRILCAASIGGQALDLELLAKLLDVPRAVLEAELPELERRHFVMFDGERYAFVAPILADIVSHEYLTRGERKALRRRAAAALASRTDLEGRVLRVELLARAEPGEPAVNEAVMVAQDALAGGSIRTARRALTAAERAAAGLVPAPATLAELRSHVLKASAGNA